MLHTLNINAHSHTLNINHIQGEANGVSESLLYSYPEAERTLSLERHFLDIEFPNYVRTGPFT